MTESALDRTARALDLVPYLLEHQGISVAELAQVFGVSEKQINSDLILIHMCGLPGYTPLELIEMYYEDGYVTVSDPQSLNKPRKMNRTEITSLLVSLDLLKSARSDSIAEEVLALLALTVDETDEAFANIYSAAVSMQNLAPRLRQRGLIVACSAIATLGALAIDLTRYAQFLYLLGAFFVPLFGVLLADWLRCGRHYRRADIFDGPLYRPGMIGAWLVGFFFYEWIAQTQGLGFWTEFLGRLHPLPKIGASLPSFALAFGLAWLVGLFRRRASD